MTPHKTQGSFFDSSIKSGLYCITCIPLQKHYIGSSTHVIRRLNAHKSNLNRGCHQIRELQDDYNTYGLDKFIFQKLLLGAGLSGTCLETLETQILLTLQPEQRYNKYTNWRKRGSETNPFYGKHHTKEAREAQSRSQKGKKSNFAGFTQTNEIKQMLSQQNSGQSSKDRRKPLFIDSIYYESVSEAAELTGLSRRLIRERCHSSEERFKNYKWA